jgi:anti-sigma regulatory factor (Ser/Thr protein kinase)
MTRELTIEADYGLLDEARQLVHSTGRGLGFDETAIYDMKVAATEALANAIEHGVASDRLVHLRMTPGDHEVWLEISGGGRSEPESAAPDPRRGRGLALMSNLMDEVVLRREGHHMLVRLAKRLPRS